MFCGNDGYGNNKITFNRKQSYLRSYNTSSSIETLDASSCHKQIEYYNMKLGFEQDVDRDSDD